MRVRNAALVAMLAAAHPSPAVAATPEVAVVSGIGGIQPPAGVLPQEVTVTFGGSALLLGTPRPCSMSGPATESLAAGTGTLSGTCGDLVLECSYERAGALMTWQCSTDAMGVLVGTFAYRPLNVNPTSIFALNGVLAGATV